MIRIENVYVSVGYVGDHWKVYDGGRLMADYIGPNAERKAHERKRELEEPTRKVGSV